MEYIGIGIVIAVIIAAGIIIYTKFNKREAIPSGDLVSVSTTSGKDELAEIHQENELIIQMEMLPAEAIDDETKLVEITDSKVLAHVNNLVPGLAQAGNAVNNAAQAVQAANGEVLYTEIFKEWLPGNSDYEIAGMYNIEYYTAPCDYPKGNQDENYYCEIWMPGKSKEQ